MLSNISRQVLRNTYNQKKRWSQPIVQLNRNATVYNNVHFKFYTAQVKATVDFEAKYADKIKKIAQKEGLTVEQLKQKIKDEAAKKLKAAKPKKVVNPIAKETSNNSHVSAASTMPGKTQMPYDSSAPTLDKLVKLDLLEKETPENIAKIWNAGHANQDCITAVIPSETYDTLYKRGQEYPMFVVPMPREQGVEFFFLQFNYNQCNFTSLLEYKTKGTEARPFLTLTHFPELQQSKGIVLMKGEINKDPKMLDTANAQFLAFALQHFYVTGGDEKFKLVEKFHKSPGDFDFNELIKAVETLV